MYVWLAVDRVRNQVVDLEVTESREFSSWLPMAMRLESKYEIDITTSDDCFTYQKYKISNQHIVTKSETALVESKNSLIRHYLARFNRKTKRFTKAMGMAKHSLILLFNKDVVCGVLNNTSIFSYQYPHM